MRPIWIHNPSFDLSFLHVPVWLCWGVALILPSALLDIELPVWVWVGVVLCVDVGHVWSSLLRTYLDPQARTRFRIAFRVVPVFSLCGCFALAFHSEALFWRVLAYVAVYHFIKQQVGIAALYRSRQRFQSSQTARRVGVLDRFSVYVGTLFPIVSWHLDPQKTIDWFVPGDFISLDVVQRLVPEPLMLGGALFFKCVWVAVPIYWLGFHAWWARKARQPFPLGKAFWVLGTALNWFLGVYLDSDVVFTLTNVVAHGVPYYGLIGLYSLRKARATNTFPLLRKWGWPGFFAVLVVVAGVPAFGEEYLWNHLLYEDYRAFFQAVLAWPLLVLESPIARACAIALLSLPQVTHYILDGMIWKFGPQNPRLRHYLLGESGR